MCSKPKTFSKYLHWLVLSLYGFIFWSHICIYIIINMFWFWAANLNISSPSGIACCFPVLKAPNPPHIVKRSVISVCIKMSLFAVTSCHVWLQDSATPPSCLPLSEALSTALFAITAVFAIPASLSLFLSLSLSKKMFKNRLLVWLVLFSYIWSTKSCKTFSGFIFLLLVLFKHWGSFCGCEISGDFRPHVFESSLLQIVSLILLCLKSRTLANLRTRCVLTLLGFWFSFYLGSSF